MEAVCYLARIPHAVPFATLQLVVRPKLTASYTVNDTPCSPLGHFECTPYATLLCHDKATHCGCANCGTVPRLWYTLYATVRLDCSIYVIQGGRRFKVECDMSSKKKELYAALPLFNAFGNYCDGMCMEEARKMMFKLMHERMKYILSEGYMDEKFKRYSREYAECIATALCTYIPYEENKEEKV